MDFVWKTLSGLGQFSVAGIVGAALWAVIAALLDGLNWRDFFEDVWDAISSSSPSERVGIGLVALGCGSLWISYRHLLWVGGSRQAWWENLHVNLGSAFIVLGLLDVIVLGRLKNR